MYDMSEDPIIAIRQVVECIDEGCVPGNGHVTSGWLRRASKDEILDWVYGNLRGRVINALKRTEEAFADLHVNVDLRLQLEKKRNCDRFNSGDPEKDADDALHAYLDEGVAGFRAVARYLLSPIKEKTCKHVTDATI